MGVYLEKNQVEESIRNYFKDAVNDGYKWVDPVDASADLVKGLDKIPSISLHDTSIKKCNFIENYLQPFLIGIDNDIKVLSYEYDESTNEEYCHIRYKTGFERKVCITGDSNKAITRDCLSQI